MKLNIKRKNLFALEAEHKTKQQVLYAQQLLLGHCCDNCWHHLYPGQSQLVCEFTPEQMYESGHTCARWYPNTGKNTY